ncbi:alpha/beta hydrolase [Melissospora conviva]|uniref:alpha/beta hydrolase n=1 Tax=Melissospora conviva TaxID=3388432 RepID=UPI003C23E468
MRRRRQYLPDRTHPGPPRSARGPAARVTAALTTLLTAATMVLVTGAGATAAADSHVVEEQWRSPREVDLIVHSAANNRDLPVRVLVPPGWSRTADRTWPVLYLLHGGRDDYTSWTRETDIEQLAAEAGVLVVMPEAGRSAIYTDFHRVTGSTGSGKWETFHLDEVWSILRAEYRAGDTRAVAGISSGGYGAIVYAARRPGTFRFAAAYSAPLNLFNPATRAVFASTVAEHGDDLTDAWGSPVTNRANWRAHNPLDLTGKLRGTRLYLSSGTTGLPGALDPNGSWSPVQFGEAITGADTTTFATRLLLSFTPVTTNLYLSGTHSWPYWQRELHRSWPSIMTSLGVPAASPVPPG